MKAAKSGRQCDRSLPYILGALVVVLTLMGLVFASTGRRNQAQPAAKFSPPPVVPTPTSEPPTAAPTPTINPRPPLRALAEEHGLLVGTAVDPGYLKNEQYASFLTREFNAVVPEVAMKWDTIHPEPGRYDFSRGDAVVAFARQNGLKVRGHTLVWGMQLPEWVLKGDYTREQWIEILREHITIVVGHYRGANNDHTVIAWDVVNEAVDKQGGLFENFWLQKIGPEYIPLAFEFAHAADPEALLFYNDNGGEGLSPKSLGVYNLVKGLVDSGVPIQGVGLQLHTAPEVAPSTEALMANMRRLDELGLIVHITELDVRIQNSQGSVAERLQRQAETYRQIMDACLLSPNCKAFFTWGLTDHYSWIPAYTGKPDAPLLFGENYEAKPALEAILDLLQSR